MKVWTRFPFVRLLFPLIAGILLCDLYSYHGYLLQWLVLVPLPVLFGFLFLKPRFSTYRSRWIFGVLISIQVLFLGYYLSLLENRQLHYNHFSGFRNSEAPVYSAYLLEPPQVRANSAKLILSVNKVIADGKAYKVSGKLLAFTALDSLVDSLDYGVEIMFSQKPESIRPPPNPGEFNYARYLSVNNVYHQVYLGKGSYIITGKNRGNILKAFALNARSRLLKTMQQYGITGHEYAVAAALLIGYDDMLDATQRKEYSGAGVVHILCVSGLHVGVVFLIADTLFFFLRKQKKALWLRPLLIILVIWLYSLITGLAPSVLRAALMFSMITVANSLNRHAHTYNTLAASAFILLVISPGMLYNLGFQLSYAAVAGIVTFHPHIQPIFVPGNKLTGYLWGMISVSIAAQLFTTPLSIYYFHQFPNYFLIANIIAIPLSGVLIYSGVIFVFLSFIPFLGKIASAIVVAQIKLLNFSVSFIEGLPGAVSHNLYLSSFANLVLYLLILSCFFWYLKKNKAWFYFALVTCLLLAADYAKVAIGRTNQQMLVVQSLNKHTAVSFISGRHMLVLGDSAVVSKPEILNYPMGSFRIKSGIQRITYSNLTGYLSEKAPLPANMLLKDGFFLFMGKRGVVLSPLLKLPAQGQQIKVDYVILTSNVRQNLEKLNGYFPGAFFIADVSNSMGRDKSWAKDALKLGLHYYSIRNSGAWVMNFQ